MPEYTHVMGMRQAIALLALLPACASAPDVLPAGGRPSVSASAAGATMTAWATPWQGAPYDLGDYLTPVALAFENAGGAPIRISYYDIALTDESGRRYAALNPFVAAGATTRLPTDGSAVLVAGRGGGGFRGGGFRAPARIGVRAPALPRRTIIGGPRYHAGVVGGGLRGYHPFPHYRRWYGPGWAYWDYPFLYPPGYASWVWAWGPAYYPSPEPPEDVLEYGLPEGVLEPGGHVEGWVYFQRATDRADRLALTWTLVDARTGQPLGQAAVPLDVVR